MDDRTKELEELKSTGPVKRTSKILQIDVVELLQPEEDGLELNEGYEYEINGALPQLADGFAKMLIELDKDTPNTGSGLLTLINEYYKKLK